MVRAAGPVIAAIDASRFAQVVTNLLDNAIRYSPGGLVEVEVQAPSSDAVQLAVTDQGSGIPPEVFTYRGALRKFLSPLGQKKICAFLV